MSERYLALAVQVVGRLEGESSRLIGKTQRLANFQPIYDLVEVRSDPAILLGSSVTADQ